MQSRPPFTSSHSHIRHEDAMVLTQTQLIAPAEAHTQRDVVPMLDALEQRSAAHYGQAATTKAV